jgi:hypothetical protein
MEHGMNIHSLPSRNIRTGRNKTPYVFKAAILFMLITLVGAVSAAAQSPTPSQETEDQDLINPDRPGIADGSTVIGPQRIQIESGIQEEFRRDSDTHTHTFFIPTLLRIGINSRWEARIEGNTFTRISTFIPGDATTQTAGLSPLSFGLKYHIQDSKGVHHPSLGTIIRVFPAWGTGDFRTHHVTGDLRLAMDWDFAPQLKLSLNPNVGLGRYEDNQGKPFTTGLFAVTLNYLPTKKVNPFIDMGL